MRPLLTPNPLRPVRDPSLIRASCDRPNLYWSVVHGEQLGDAEMELQVPRVSVETPTSSRAKARGCSLVTSHAPHHAPRLQPGAPRARSYAAQDLHEWICEHEGAGLIYVAKRSEADRLASLLSDAGVDAAAYHAGLERSVRQRVQADFTTSSTRVVVATIAFGMGINKSDVRWVIHWDLPKSLESE